MNDARPAAGRAGERYLAFSNTPGPLGLLQLLRRATITPRLCPCPGARKLLYGAGAHVDACVARSRLMCFHSALGQIYGGLHRPPGAISPVRGEKARGKTAEWAAIWSGVREEIRGVGIGVRGFITARGARASVFEMIMRVYRGQVEREEGDGGRQVSAQSGGIESVLDQSGVAPHFSIQNYNSQTCK